MLNHIKVHIKNAKIILMSGWTHYVWDKISIEKFIKKTYPEYWHIYDYFNIMVQKIDFAKILIIYHFGGAYIDMDMVCLKNIDDLIKPNDTLIFSNMENNLYLSCGIFLSSAKNIFLVDLFRKS
jgi:mannosyltransferase OCH1-like enzyme